MPFDKSFKIVGSIFYQTKNSQESFEERMLKAHNLGGCKHLQKQRCTLGALGWWSKSTAFSSLDSKLGCGVSRLRTTKKKGWQTNTTIRLYRIRGKERGVVGQLLHWEYKICQKKQVLPILSEFIAESLWRTAVWACEWIPNAVLATLRHALKRRSTCWWTNMKALHMLVVPNNHAREGNANVRVA